MKPQTYTILVAIMVVFLGLSPLKAQITTTDTFGSGANSFSIDFVTVGNPGNAANANDAFRYGAVPYVYRMGTYEITQDAIDKATASGLSNVTAGWWTGSQPATNVSWYEAAAFVNWLNTSKGYHPAYNLTFATSWSMSRWGAGDQATTGVGIGTNPYRHKDTYYFLPSDDEWYKAAYHKNDGVTANYWVYATGSDTAPIAVASGTMAGTAVYDQLYDTEPALVTNAGGLSPYGTMGQGGNVDEWVESPFGFGDNSEWGAIRGGAWVFPESILQSTFRNGREPFAGGWPLGFRVASVPEPSTYALLLIAGAGAIWWVRRRRV